MCGYYEKAVGGGSFCSCGYGCSTALTVDTLIVAVTKANTTILKQVPKHARIPLAKLLNDGIVAKPHDELRWVSFFLQFCAIMN